MACKVFLGEKSAYKEYKSNRSREKNERGKKAAERGAPAQRGATMAASRPQSPGGGYSPARSMRAPPLSTLSRGQTAGQALSSSGPMQSTEPQSLYGNLQHSTTRSNVGNAPGPAQSSHNQVSNGGAPPPVSPAVSASSSRPGTASSAAGRPNSIYQLGDMTRSYIEGMVPNQNGRSSRRHHRYNLAEIKLGAIHKPRDWEFGSSQERGYLLSRIC